MFSISGQCSDSSPDMSGFTCNIIDIDLIRIDICTCEHSCTILIFCSVYSFATDVFIRSMVADRIASFVDVLDSNVTLSILFNMATTLLMASSGVVRCSNIQ